MPKHYRPPGKKKEGNAAKYVTRTQAVKHLQVSLPIFRKLCILKGVFPREPKKKVKGNHQTYYHSKDVAFIHHDPIVEVFRGQRVIDKKVKKALSKKNKDRAEILRRKKPTIDLGRLILQRYPRFVDALGDLDDCLTMVHLFAALPTLQNEKVEVSRIHNCRRLSHEWQAFIARTHNLRKTFISVKGIYYQAEVDGQKITWITPHALQQVMSDDIDYNVMLTFLDFYEALLAFVNFKLYHSIKVTYPPVLDPELEALAADLYALSRYVDRKSAAASVELDESQLTLGQLQHQMAPTEPGTLMQLIEETDVEDKDDEETKECKSLFRNMKFFLSREVPRECLLFVISAFGGMVSWEGHGAPFDESDQSINYQIVDRPMQGHMFLAREYIQPQWIFDCVNTRLILPTEDYLVGRVPPPHLSPFVNNEEENYTPDYAEKIKQLQAAAKKNVLPVPAIEQDDLNDTENAMLEGIASRVEAKEAAEKKKKMLKLERQYHEELKMEVQGVSNASGSSVAEPTSAGDMDSHRQGDIDDGGEAKEANDMNNEMAKLMMSRRKKGLLEAIEIGKKRKQAEVDLLKSRKRKLEQSQYKSGKGKNSN